MLSNLPVIVKASQRIDQEAQTIKQALFPVTADYTIFEEAVNAWINTFDRKHELCSFRFIR